ncbi:MAG: type II toxin-antitoxin system VapC family toxin [Dehalococcoidia bacterium]|nr:type II toxin-antitoxin system VapC family toxin [Dehalococcoidia bacterium]
MAARVCVDASLVLTALLPDSLTPTARALWRVWVEQSVEIIAPPLFFAEVTSVLREKVHFGHISPEQGEDLFSVFLHLGVGSADFANLQANAWAMAKAHNRPRAYDAQYLAVAADLGCDLWTGDRRLVNAVGVSWVKWLGSYVPGSP